MKMFYFKLFLDLHVLFFIPLRDKKGQEYVDRLRVFSHSSNTGSTGWHWPSDYKRYPINPEAAISDANLNLREVATKLWWIISPLAPGVNAEWLFYGWPEVGGHQEIWTSKEHKGTVRDGSLRQAHSVQSSAQLLPLLFDTFLIIWTASALLNTVGFSSGSSFTDIVAQSALSH